MVLKYSYVLLAVACSVVQSFAPESKSDMMRSYQSDCLQALGGKRLEEGDTFLTSIRLLAQAKNLRRSEFISLLLNRDLSKLEPSIKNACEMFDVNYKDPVSIENFQRALGLPVTGVIDTDTFFNVFTSSGNKLGELDYEIWCIDTRFQLTDTTLKNLKGVVGDEIVVGRYISNSRFLLKPLDKRLTEEEIKSYKKYNVKVALIYQENATTESCFKRVPGEHLQEDGKSFEYIDETPYNAGANVAEIAANSARDLGVPHGTYIFFAVNFDATDTEIDNTIIPWFKGIASQLQDYEIGVYGTRLVCTKVTEAMPTRKVLAWYSDEANIYNGNMGYPVATNWIFRQIDVRLKYDGIEVDKNIKNTDIIKKYPNALWSPK